MYYGTLAEANGGIVRLTDVFYVRTESHAAGVPPTNQLVSRRKADWHSPDWMAVPTDKILFIEAVGLHSQVAALIAQDHSGPQ